MYAIISELDPQSSRIIADLWQRLYDTCGLKAIYNVPTPHFSWFAAEDLDIQRAAPILSQIAQTSDALAIHTFGLGLFSGRHPVLYLPMVKSAEMISFHHQIWNQIQPYSQDPKLYYSPKLWIPHITLALKDLSPENLACAVNSLAFDPFELLVIVESISIAEYTDENLGQTLKQYHLQPSFLE